MWWSDTNWFSPSLSSSFSLLSSSEFRICNRELPQHFIQNSLKQNNIFFIGKQTFCNLPHPSAPSQIRSQAQIPCIIYQPSTIMKLTQKDGPLAKYTKQAGPAVRKKVNWNNFDWHERISQGSFGGRPGGFY